MPHTGETPPGPVLGRATSGTVWWTVVPWPGEPTHSNQPDLATGRVTWLGYPQPRTGPGKDLPRQDLNKTDRKVL